MIKTIVIGLVTAGAFALSWCYGLINLDDYVYVLNHPEVTGGLSWGGVKWAFTWMGDGMWTPLTWLSYMADHTIGWGVKGMHVEAIILQSISAMILFRLLLSLMNEPDARASWMALVATLIWSVHPLRVESVVWVAIRKDMLSTVFFLASLLAWSRSRWLVALLLFALGGLAKSSVMLFPVFAVLIDAVFLRKRKPYAVYAVILVLSAALAYVAGSAQKEFAALGPEVIPLWYRLLNALAALTLYVGHTLCPTDLAVQCQLRYPALPRFSPLGLALLAAYGWWTYRLARRIYEARSAKALAAELGAWACVLAYFVCLGPFLGIVGFGVHAFADRFTILPALALSLAIVPACRLTKNARALVALGLAVCLGLVALTIWQTRFWADDERLFGRTVEIDGPRNVTAQYVLALHHWENTHDMDKVYRHLVPLLDAPDWAIRQVIEDAGYMLVEAAYETGHEQDGERAFRMLQAWNDERVGEIQRHGGISIQYTDSYLYAETIRMIYIDATLTRAKKRARELREIYHDKAIVCEIDYLIAKREGDAAAIAAARAACAAAKGDSYHKNAWAKR